MICKCEGRVRNVGWHEGDEPSCHNTRFLVDVLTSNRSDRENGECTIDRWKSQHCPPYSIVTSNEWLQERCQHCNRPCKQWRTWVDAPDWIGSIRIEDKMCIVGENVINDALHVPRVRTTGHVPSVGPEGVHRWDDVPLDANNESEEERHTDHDAGPVCVPEPSSA